jgi:hypothetical protein
MSRRHKLFLSNIPVWQGINGEAIFEDLPPNSLAHFHINAELRGGYTHGRKDSRIVFPAERQPADVRICFFITTVKPN